MWPGKLKLRIGHRAQAMVEFSLTLLTFLLVLFLMIEVGRLLYAFVAVHHAAREGARYGVTGQWETDFVDPISGSPVSDCQPIPGYEPLRDARTCSIEMVTETSMLGLPIDETAPSTGDYFFRPVVYGYDSSTGTMVLGYGGTPSGQIVVQVEYRLRIITPLLSAIAPNVRLTATAVMLNESFGSTGIQSEPVLPPPLPTVPTVGDSPTPSPSPTASDTATPTDTATATATPTPCPASFLAPPIHSFTYVVVGGEPGSHVEIRDLNTGVIIGTGDLSGTGYCGGSATITVSPALVGGHTLVALNPHGAAQAVVLMGTLTPTASYTPSAVPTDTLLPSPTFTPSETLTPSSTPNYAYFTASPTCGGPGTVSVTLRGYNWPTSEGFIRIRMDGATQTVIDPPTAVWVRTVNMSFSEGLHVLSASTIYGTAFQVFFSSPCAPTPTFGPTSTPTYTPPATQVPLYARFVNVGQPGPCGDVSFEGVTWQRSQQYGGGNTWGYDGSDYTLRPENGSQIQNTDGSMLPSNGQTLYRCRMYGTDFSYHFQVPNGQYYVILGFADASNDAGARYFDVEAEGIRILNDFDIVVAAGARARRVDRYFTTVVTDGVLDIRFRGDQPGAADESAILQAIGVVHIPPTPTPDARTSTATPSATLTPSSTPTSTNTPTPADLVVESVSLVTANPRTFQPLEFDVVVRNTGQTPASNLFWVDLYADPPEPVGASIPSVYSVDFAGVPGLSGGASLTLRMTVPYFSTTGSHRVYAMADTSNRISESNETNNVGGPATFTVNDSGITPTATLAPTNTLSVGTGSISGHTWIYAGQGWQVPTGRVNIFVYDQSSGDLVAQTESESDGTYLVTNLPPDVYTVIGRATLVNPNTGLETEYYDARSGVVVVAGLETQNVDLFLIH
jgi:hypothetical protein